MKEKDISLLSSHIWVMCYFVQDTFVVYKYRKGMESHFQVIDAHFLLGHLHPMLQTDPGFWPSIIPFPKQISWMSMRTHRLSGTWCDSSGVLHRARSWTLWSWCAPSNSAYSMILCAGYSVKSPSPFLLYISCLNNSKYCLFDRLVPSGHWDLIIYISGFLV